MPAGLAALFEIGCDQRANLFINQRPERVAAQAGEGAEGDGDGAVFAAQQPGADAGDAVVAAAGEEAVDGVVGREGQGDVAEGDEVGGPGERGFAGALAAIQGQVADADGAGVGVGVADDVEPVAAGLLRQAVDQFAGLRALHAGKNALAIDVEQHQMVVGAVEVAVEQVGGAERADGGIDD